MPDTIPDEEPENHARSAEIETAIAHQQAGRLADALAICRRVLDDEPDHPMGLQLLGVLQLQSGNAKQAIATLDRLLELHPTATGALLSLGSARHACGDDSGAEAAYRQLLEVAPQLPEGHYTLGRLLMATGRRGDGAAHLARAVALRPTWAEAVNELGVAKLQGIEAGPDWRGAAELFHRAAELAPDWPLPAHNLGESLEVGGDTSAAVAVYRKVLARWPGFDQARQNHAYGLLKLGQFEIGWKAHEWRFAAGGRTPAREGWDVEVWDGSSFTGRTLVVWTEQGLGDNLQFVRYLPQVAERGGRVWLQSPAVLAGLMATCMGVDRVVVGDPPLQEIDLQVPLMTLPGIFGTTLTTVPAEVPYLKPPVAVPETLLARLEAGRDELRVGLIWKSGTLMPAHAARDLDADHVMQLLAVPGVHWFPLQFNERLADLVGDEVADLAIDDLGPELGDFGATGAIVAELDLVITVDTSALHLAGALGKQVWALIPKPADWRWLKSRDDSPWYPTLRLFRQECPGDWRDPVTRLAAELREMAAVRRGSRPGA